MSKRFFGLFVAIAASSLTLAAQALRLAAIAQHPTIALWPGAAPGATANPPAEADTTTAKDNLIAGRPLIRLGNVSAPTLTLYQPKNGGTGAAVVVFPGGGYQHFGHRSGRHRGLRLAELRGHHLRAAQISRAQHRPLSKVSRRLAGCPARPRPGAQPRRRMAYRPQPHRRSRFFRWRASGCRTQHSLRSASLRPNRRRRQAELPSRLCHHRLPRLPGPGRQELRSQPRHQPNAETPPTFIVQTEDDPAHVENAVVYFMALKNAKVPAELHIYAEGGHGYGLRKNGLPVHSWPSLVETWLKTIKMSSGLPD